MKSTRLARLAAEVRCVTIGIGLLRHINVIKPSKGAAEDFESSAPVGSSANKISGSVIIARATAAHCFDHLKSHKETSLVSC